MNNRQQRRAAERQAASVFIRPMVNVRRFIPEEDTTKLLYEITTPRHLISFIITHEELEQLLVIGKHAYEGTD